MRRFLALFFFPFVLAAQTAVTVQNPSFETANAFTAGIASCGVDDYNLNGPIPSWTATGSGYFGSWQPCSTFFTSIPDGATIAYTNGPTLTQDLGVTAQANATYTLTVYVGRRLDSVTGVATIQLLAGTTSLCSLNVDSSTLTQGAFAKQTLSCPASAPSGDLIISLGCSGVQCSFDNVSLTFTPGPFVFTLQNCGSSTCTFTFPMQSPASCTAADGTCSLSIQVCDTSVTPPNCLILGSQGEIDIIKTVTLPAPQTQTTPVVKATSP